MTLIRTGAIGVALLLCMLIVHPAFSTPFENETKTLQTEIDDFMVERMDTLKIPGAAIGVVQGDQAVYIQGYGQAGESFRLPRKHRSWWRQVGAQSELG